MLLLLYFEQSALLWIANYFEIINAADEWLPNQPKNLSPSYDAEHPSMINRYHKRFVKSTKVMS